MLTDFFSGVFALLAGFLLGVFYFAGLWWTVRRLTVTHHVALFFISSLMFRLTVVVVGFWFILGNSWQHLLLGLLGFTLLRVLAVRFARTADFSPLAKPKDTYAP